jgi:hypothetical protein
MYMPPSPLSSNFFMFSLLSLSILEGRFLRYCAQNDNRPVEVIITLMTSIERVPSKSQPVQENPSKLVRQCITQWLCTGALEGEERAGRGRPCNPGKGLTALCNLAPMKWYNNNHFISEDGRQSKGETYATRVEG